MANLVEGYDRSRRYNIIYFSIYQWTMTFRVTRIIQDADVQNNTIMIKQSCFSKTYVHNLQTLLWLLI